MKNALESLSPKFIFLFGIAQVFLVLCTIGFFILLCLFIRNDGFSGPSFAKATAGAVAPTVTDSGGQPAPANVEIREVDESRDHIRGSKNAKVTIVTYTDLECPFCKRFHDTMAEVMQKYGNDLRMVYRHFPLDQLHSQARTEANATECANEQGKFWELTDIIFQQTASNDGLDLSKLNEYAKQAGVKDIAQFSSCVEQNKFASKIQEDETDGQGAGAQGTPYSILLGPNGEKVPLNGAYPTAQVEQLIDSLLNA